MRRGLTAAGPRRPHLCGLRFFVLRRPGAPAAPEPGPRAEGKASEPDTRSPARHAAPISRRTTEAAIYAASVFLTSAAPAPRQLQSRSPPPWSGTDTPAVPKPGLAPQGKHRSSARNIPAARHPHFPEPAGKKHPLPAPPSTPAPPEKAPSRTPSQTPLRTHTRRGRAPEPAPPYIRILARTIRPPNRLGKSTLFLPRLPRPRRPEKRRSAPLSAPTHPPAPGKSSGARPHTSASSPTCTSLRLPAHAPHPSFPSRHPATPEKTSPRIPPAASPRLPAPPSASPPRQAQKKRQPAKGCRASFKPPGD